MSEIMYHFKELKPKRKKTSYKNYRKINFICIPTGEIVVRTKIMESIIEKTHIIIVNCSYIRIYLIHLIQILCIIWMKITC